MSTPISQYQCVRLNIYGIGKQAIYTHGADDRPANIPSAEIYIVDPENPAICRLASDTDKEFRERCLMQDIVFAWAPPWIVNGVPLTRHIEPSRPKSTGK